MGRSWRRRWGSAARRRRQLRPIMFRKICFLLVEFPLRVRDADPFGRGRRRAVVIAAPVDSISGSVSAGSVGS
eukprot:7382114-Lingulodinium_polyedra.AAC.1